jgi:acyl carrier protein
MTFQELRNRLYSRMAELAGCPVQSINSETTLEDVGLDSSDAVILAMEVEEIAGHEIDVGVFLRFATLGEAVEELARTLQIEPAQNG